VTLRRWLSSDSPRGSVSPPSSVSGPSRLPSLQRANTRSNAARELDDTAVTDEVEEGELPFIREGRGGACTGCATCPNGTRRSGWPWSRHGESSRRLGGMWVSGRAIARNDRLAPPRDAKSHHRRSARADRLCERMVQRREARMRRGLVRSMSEAPSRADQPRPIRHPSLLQRLQMLVLDKLLP